MKTLIRILALALSIVMCFTVVGCKNDDGKKSNNKGGNSGNSNANQYVDSDVLNSREEYEKKHDVYNHPELKGKTVKFATWIDHSTTEAQYAVESFEAATGMKFEWVEVSQFGYLDTMTKLIAAGNSPDVFVGVGDEFPKDYQIAQPVDKISTFDIKDPIWDKDWMDTYKLGDHYYMLNTIGSIWKGGDLCYYNRTLLEDNGIMTPHDYYDNGEWSLEAMLEIMQNTAALGENYSGGLIDPKLMGAALGAGLGYWKNGELHNGCNNDSTYQAWRYFYTAKEAGYYNYGITRNDFAQGRAALWMDDVYALKSSGYFSSGIEENMLAWIQLPSKVNKTDSEQENNISAIPRVYGVCAGAKNPEGAVLFLRYFLDPLNYDWDSAFINEEAKEYYLTLNDVTSDQRIYDKIGMTPSNVSRNSDIGKVMFFTTSAQLKTSLDSINNAVDAKIKEFNTILDEVKKRDK